MKQETREELENYKKIAKCALFKLQKRAEEKDELIQKLLKEIERLKGAKK